MAANETTVPSAGASIRTLETADASAAKVETQVVALADAGGAVMTALTESTGQDILRELERIRRCLAAIADHHTGHDPSDDKD